MKPQQDYIQMSSSKRSYRQRLQMIASYENFSPQVLACSDPIRWVSSAPSSSSPAPSFSLSTSHMATNYTNEGLIDTAERHQLHSKTATTTSTNTTEPIATTTTTTTTTTISYNNTTSSSSSLGAIAGSDGIIVFRWEEPQIPMLVLSYTNITGVTINHHHQNQNPTSTSLTSTFRSGITSLSFSPSNYQQHQQQRHHIDPSNYQHRTSSHTISPMYLGAIRGSSILIWNVSGPTIQPLQYRLGMTPSGTIASSSVSTITSMTWITIPDSSSTHNNHNLHIAATTSSMAGIWDLGSSSSSSSSSSSPSGGNHFNSTIHRPCIRFADASKYQEYSPYVQIACSNRATIDGLQCAILSASGMVRIYNLHITTDGIAVTNDYPVYQLEACHSTGVGLSYMTLHKSSTGTYHNGWVTWGFDASNTDPIVKVWMGCGNTTDPNKDVDGEDNHRPEYRLIGQCTTPNLACARVGPSPICNTIVTVSFNNIDDGENLLNWQTDVWRVDFNENNATNKNETTELKACDSNDNDDDNDDYGLMIDSTLEHIAVFNGPSDENSLESVLVGREFMPLRAADLALIQSTDDEKRKNELILCCLTENGFVTTLVRTFLAKT
jgi:hypothetical protein